MTVREARTFILNYLKGRGIDPTKFDLAETNPVLSKIGERDQEWDNIRISDPSFWADPALKTAGSEFAKLVHSQRSAFIGMANGKKKKPNVDFAEKALNYAVLSAWSFVAGLLEKNQMRLQRHFDLANQASRDPLNASAPAKGRHKSDPENYRGLGYRTDPKERGRFVELFYLQAEKGEGITTLMVELAIKKYHAKDAQLEVSRTEQKISRQ